MKETDILELEQALLREEVRSSADRIAEILDDGCVEFCSSGKIYRYAKGDTFGHGKRRDWEIVDFQAEELASDIVLAKYRLLKHDEPNEAMRASLRSSIWKAIDGKWKMVFHQGTPSRSEQTGCTVPTGRADAPQRSRDPHCRPNEVIGDD